MLRANRTATASEAEVHEAEEISAVAEDQWFRRVNGAEERDYRIADMGADIEVEEVVVAEVGEEKR